MEEDKEQGFHFELQGKSSRYDRRLILKIVGLVEDGLPHKEAMRIYGMGSSTLGSWLREHGSPHYHGKLKRKSYPNLQKRSIASAIEQGRMSVGEARSAYGIKTERTIRGWVQQYRTEKVELCGVKEQPKPEKTVPVDTSEVDALRRALQEAELRIKALNTLIDVAEEQLKTDIRKKSGAKPSGK